jgi:hypothetical protein
VGGIGTLWIDDLKFEPLPPEVTAYPAPIISASSFEDGHPAGMMIDQSPSTSWKSRDANTQVILMDFLARREFGGLKIRWDEENYATRFELLLSEDGTTWEEAYTVHSNKTGSSFVRLPEASAKYLKLVLKESNSGTGFGIREIKIMTIENSLTKNDFLIYTAKDSPLGDYPRYFLEQASYWTVTGVNNDVKEALINEDGMVEVDKGLFSIEPMIKIDNTLYNWSNVRSSQSLGFMDGQDFQFRPTVTWEFDRLELRTEVMSVGKANESAALDIHYSIINFSGESKNIELYLLIRPFQVNPYYQWLNITGGVGHIRTIGGTGQEIMVDDKKIISTVEITNFGAYAFDEGNVVDRLRRGQMPENKSAEDVAGLAGGVIQYSIHLGPYEKQGINVVVPFYGEYDDKMLRHEDLLREHKQEQEFWQGKVGHIRFNLPPSADRIINAYKANLAYILINRDKAGIQPGSRSYERSWIRDGALTSSALLKSGIVTEVRDFIDWYADHQFENGKVPCVVDFRGPDPVPENDSHGELIYLVREYFNFTHDTAYLRSKNEHVLKAVEYIELLVAERSTDHYRFGNDSIRSHFGLVPESISHEGYSAKPMHSYWDNFFTMKGLKDAADIQKILGEDKNYEHICGVRDTFRENLYNSLELAMQVRGIDYIPGCVELGDFDATSTTIALTPCNELNNLPKPEVYNTFDKYYAYFKARRDGTIEWVNYTPYENRLIGSFILLDQPEKAHELIEFFLDDQRPQGWHHWAEVVWKDDRHPGFIGDMPHTWVGSDFINAIRSMFVYENEYDQTLVIASALYQDWIDAPGGMSVENLPTYYGGISYSVKKVEDAYSFSIYGDAELPANGIRIKNFNGSKLPVKVMIDGVESKDFSQTEIRVNAFPAEIEIYY